MKMHLQFNLILLLESMNILMVQVEVLSGK